jgi:hypothetical protein
MSFGTGHHETTHMMIQHLLETDVTGMKTLIWVAVQQFWYSCRNERPNQLMPLTIGLNQ